MELFETVDYYIFIKGENSLWCNRKSGQLEPKKAWDITLADDPTCLGLVHGIIGKMYFPDSDPKLLLIESCSLVGHVWNNQPIYKINKIGLLNLGVHESEINTRPCSKHSHSVAFNQEVLVSSKQNEAFSKTWGSIKSATMSLRSTTVQAAQRIGIDGRDGERESRKLCDEVEKMFLQSESFYFSPDVDLTNSVQALGAKYFASNGSWQSANPRFFWNEHLLKELIDLENEMADPWIVPVLHGYIHIDTISVDLDGFQDFGKPLTLMLISRRSRHRAGTRYKRRGVDEQGHVANYVETEQCLLFGNHILSFVQIRGSVPIYWSQPGFKYRPPPQIDRGTEENREAFHRHFERELAIYGHQCIISLVEKNGKEKIIGDAYTNQINQLNDNRLTYVTFDFHEQCRGMRFENVAKLVNGIEDILQEMRYSWVDSHGLICHQESTFRINCMDCLDRTNVVQTALGKYVLERQLNKLGILPPEGTFWQSLKSAFNIMWANNGDVLSKQYAGTNALKGDYTRTGERRFAGMMKDGMNSANRYYVNRFKDTLKQVAIDLMLGNIHPDDAPGLLCGQTAIEDNEEVVLQTADRVRQVIDDCRKQFISRDEIIVGSWGLVDAHPISGDPTQVDMNVIIILTQQLIYIFSYDDDTDQMMDCRRYPLSSITKLEVGSELKRNPINTGVQFFKSPKRELKTTPVFLMRIHIGNISSPEIIQLRSTKLRFFNNMAVPICKTEDMNESLKAIAENIHVTMEISGITIPFYIGHMEKFPKVALEVRKSELTVGQGLPRNVSEGQLSAIKEAGNRAVSSMTSHFSRFLSSTLRHSVQTENNEMITTSQDASTFQPKSPCIEPYFEPLSPTSPCNVDIHSLWAGILFVSQGKLVEVERATVSAESSAVDNANAAAEISSKPKVLLRCVSAGNFYERNLLKGPLFNRRLTGVCETPNMAPPPSILVSSIENQMENHSHCDIRLSKHLSHSSESFEATCAGQVSSNDLINQCRASSETNLPDTDVNSKNFSNFNYFHSAFKLPSPTHVSGNSLASLAKGVQSLSANFDPRKILESPKKVKGDENIQPHCSATRIIHL